MALLCDPELSLRWPVVHQLSAQVSGPHQPAPVITADVAFSHRSVLHKLGFSDTKALLLACPPYILAGVASVFLAYSSGRFHERTWHITAAFAVAVAGFVAAASTLNQVGRYIACFVFPVGTYAVNSVIVAWVGTTLSQSPEKKAVGWPFLSVEYCWVGC